MNDLNDQILQLKELLSPNEELDAAKIEICLNDIVNTRDPKSIKNLLQILDDSAPDELMFLIVHPIEWG